MVTNTFLGEVRIPVSEHRDMPFSYANQHWFPLFNPRHRKKDGSAGELGIKVGAQGGDVSEPLHFDSKNFFINYNLLD